MKQAPLVCCLFALLLWSCAESHNGKQRRQKTSNVRGEYPSDRPSKAFVIEFLRRLPAPQRQVCIDLLVSEDRQRYEEGLRILLFEANQAELVGLGITEVGSGPTAKWSVVSHALADKVAATAIIQAWEDHQVKADGVGGLGIMSWYVPKTQFIFARRVLLELRAEKGLDIAVWHLSLGPDEIRGVLGPQ
jgi:hypothetical protein